MTVTEYTAIAVPVVDEVGGAAAAASPEARAQPCLEVEAPATLPEGYKFDAQFNGQTFAVTVPAGGVKEGQKFVVPYPAAGDPSSALALSRSSAPVGHWKDGLCDCCRFGCCHPVCCNAYWCPLILLGQVMTRLKLTWLASEGTAAQVARTFRTMLIITIGYIVLNSLFSSIQNGMPPLDENGQPSQAYLTSALVSELFALAFFVFVIFVVVRTRLNIRQKYRIPEGCCGGCDDFCTAFWCSCCAISQMARHTADYDTYAGQCCSETGLPSHVPALGAGEPPSGSIV